MKTINAVGFRNDYCTEFNGVDNLAFVDNPTFRYDTVGAVLMRVRRLSAFTGNATKTLCGMGYRAGSGWSGSRVELRVIRNAGGHGPGVPGILTNNGSTNGQRNVAPNIPSAQLPADTWRHLAFVQDGIACSLLVDGDSKGTTTGSTDDRGLWWNTCTGETVRFVIGAGWLANASNQNGIASSYCDTIVDEVLILGGVAPGEAKIDAYLREGMPANPYRIWRRSNIRAWYRMGDSRDGGTTIYDATGNGNDLTLTNMDMDNYLAIPSP